MNQAELDERYKRDNVCLQFVTHAGLRSPMLHVFTVGLYVLGEVIHFGQASLVTRPDTTNDMGSVMIRFLNWLATEASCGCYDEGMALQNSDQVSVNSTHWLAFVTSQGITKLEMVND
jgi:hypothetical protein